MRSAVSRLLVCLLLALGPSLVGQVQGSNPVRRYGGEAGLESEVVSALVQDHSGMLWAGTESGIYFFNGQRFFPFSGPLPSLFVTTLFVDVDDSLWVATEGGLARIHRGQSHTFTEAEGIPARAVREVGRDVDGHLWVLTSDGIRVQDSLNRFIKATSWPGSELPSHLFSHPSLPGAWATTSRNIWFWRKEQWIAIEPPPLVPGEVLLDVAVDGDENLWVRTIGFLWRLPAQGPRKWIRSPMAGGLSHISKLSRDAGGWVWVDSAQGLWRVRGDRRVRFGHSQDDARGGMVDQEGGIWLRTDKGAMRVLGQNRWKFYGPQDGISMDTTWQPLRDHRGQLWVATDQGLLVSAGSRFKRVAKGRFLNLVQAPNGTLWASGSPGGTVYLVDTQSHQVRPLRIDALPVARITAGLTVEADGSPWVASEQDGLVRGRWSGNAWIWTPMPIQGVTPRDVRNIYALPGGGVIVLHDGTASLWRKGNWLQVPDILPENPWSATSNQAGTLIICYLNHPMLTVHHPAGDNFVRDAVLDLATPKASPTIYSVAHGDDGQVWVGTAKGLGHLDPSKPSEFTILGTEDRVTSPECNQGALLVEKDKVWIGTPAGLVSYDPTQGQAKKELRAPLILWAMAGDRTLDLLDPAPKVPRYSNDLRIQFMVPNFQFQSLSYETRLSGVDTGWVRLESPNLRYAGLRAGAHLLELRGLTGDGLIGPTTAYRFVVLPAWWERRWVQALMLLGLAGAVVALIKLRQAQLEARNRELSEEVARQTSALVAASKAKSLFLANMSHELRTPLNAILLYSELLQEDMKDHALEGPRQDAGKIHSAGQHLLGLIDDILDMSKIEAGRLRLELREFELGQFLQDLDASVRPLVEKNGNRFVVDAGREEVLVYSDPTRLRQVLVNLLSNSAKFTEKGEVTLRAWTEGPLLALQVSDTGIGMNPEEQSRVFLEFVQADESTTRKFGGTGLGLTLVKKFMELLGGEVQLDSIPKKGTTFNLRLPRSGPPPTGSGAPPQI